jgi:hypothetical protein
MSNKIGACCTTDGSGRAHLGYCLNCRLVLTCCGRWCRLSSEATSSSTPRTVLSGLGSFVGKPFSCSALYRISSTVGRSSSSLSPLRVPVSAQIFHGSVTVATANIQISKHTSNAGPIASIIIISRHCY